MEKEPLGKEVKEFEKSFEYKAIGEDGLFFFVASKQIRDRDNDLIYCGKNEKGSGIDMSEYLKNPIVLKVHENTESIGKCEQIEVSTDQDGIPILKVAIRFAEGTEEGAKAKYLYRHGFQKAVSIRFRPTEFIYNDQVKGYDIYSCKLYEISTAPLQVNQAALLIEKCMDLEKTLIEKSSVSDSVAEKLEALAKSMEASGASFVRGGNNKSIYDAVMNIEKKIKGE